MIGKLSGLVDCIDEDSVILDVAGVGYVVYVPTYLLSKLQVASHQALYIHMLVREDNISLYGFESLEQKQWFLTLQSVQGVGAKMAIAILSAMTPQDILTSIMAQDAQSFKRISGIGPKLADRIVNELKAKKNIATFVPSTVVANAPGIAKSSSLMADAVSALTNLGFDRKLVFVEVSEVLQEDEGQSLESVITKTLQRINS